jgi:hypothetical protein
VKKTTILIAFLFVTLSASCDVVFFPYEYSLISYSAELISCSEKVKTARNTGVFWGGIGCVGPLYFFDKPFFGLELAFEKRHYFKPETFRHFFFSGYIGAAYMTDFKYFHDVGIVPGIKINYKACLFAKTVLEPYISLSVPVCYNLAEGSGYVPFPVLTVGVRFGLCKLKDGTEK